MGLARKILASRVTYVPCAAFVLAAAVNDGFSRWLLGVPFLAILVLATTLAPSPFGPRTWRVTAAILLASAFLLTSRWTSGLVYGVMGEEMVVRVPLPIARVSPRWNGIGGYTYGRPRSANDVSRDDGVAPGFEAPAGSRWRVRAVHPSNPDLGLRYALGFEEVGGTRAVWIQDHDLVSITDVRETTDLCEHVQSSLCSSGRAARPMRRGWDVLSFLLYFPLPFFLVVGIL